MCFSVDFLNFTCFHSSYKYSLLKTKTAKKFVVLESFIKGNNAVSHVCHMAGTV